MVMDSDVKAANTIMQGHSVARTLTLHMPKELVGTKQEELVRDICSMAIAGVAMEAANTLLTNHGIDGVVLTTG